MTQYDRYVASRSREGRRRQQVRYGIWCTIIILWTIIVIFGTIHYSS